jgi:hypothetical protein
VSEAEGRVSVPLAWVLYGWHEGVPGQCKANTKPMRSQGTPMKTWCQPCSLDFHCRIARIPLYGLDRLVTSLTNDNGRTPLGVAHQRLPFHCVFLRWERSPRTAPHGRDCKSLMLHEPQQPELLCLPRRCSTASHVQVHPARQCHPAAQHRMVGLSRPARSEPGVPSSTIH